MPTFFEDLKAYVGFDEADVAALRRLEPHAAPHVHEIAEHFYASVDRSPGAVAAITGGAAQVERLKLTLRDWLSTGLTGPHDAVYYARRSRIGQVHVRIGLPQQYMFTAMNVVRSDYIDLIESVYADDAPVRRAAQRAVNKLLDIELAIMLHTYRNDSEERLRRHERLAALGQLAATIAHELRNPLGVIETSLYLMRRRIHDEPRLTRHLDKIEKQARTSAQIINDLLELARDHAFSGERVALRSVVDEALAAVDVPDGITVECEIDDGIVLYADPNLLTRAIANLVSNSVSVMNDPVGTVTVSARRAEREEVEIAVADTGPGFDPDVIDRVFEPLVTTRATGIGLGLSLVQRVCERHGGRVDASNRPGGGAMVKLILPLTQSVGVSSNVGPVSTDD